MSTHTSFPVSVVIPNYNGLSLLQKHLPAVLASMRNHDELIIVDDASSDESVSWLKKYFSLKKTTQPEKTNIYGGKYIYNQCHIDIILIINSRNLRFAKSCNLAVRHAKGEWIFLLNSDVSPTKSCVAALIECLSKYNTSTVFAIGCKEYQDTETRSVAGKNKIWFQRGMFIHSKADSFATGETAWVSGGSGLFNKQKWLALGGFDLAFYPAYWEDVDLSYRAQKRGWLTLFCQEAVVYHHHESTNAAVFNHNINNISWKHAHLFTRRHANMLQFILYLIWQPYWWWKRQM